VENTTTYDRPQAKLMQMWRRRPAFRNSSKDHGINTD